jgi:hypothetical protein
VEITNRAVCWLLERYFERAVTLLQRQPEPVPRKPVLHAQDKRSDERVPTSQKPERK